MDFHAQISMFGGIDVHDFRVKKPSSFFFSPFSSSVLIKQT